MLGRWDEEDEESVLDLTDLWIGAVSKAGVMEIYCGTRETKYVP